MDIRIETVEEGLYFLCGVNADLIEWAKASPSLFQKAFLRGNVDWLQLAKCFGVRDPEERRLQSIDIIERIWGTIPELGPYPLMGELKEFEENRKFYNEYRDHAAHQLYVFVLGLFVYDTCELVRDAIADEIKKSDRTKKTIQDEFLLRWTAVALMHDVGYVLENVADPNRSEQAVDPDWEKIRGALNSVLRYPLSASSLRSELSTANEELLTREHLHFYIVNLPEDLAIDPSSGEQWLTRWDTFAVNAGLGHPTRDASLLHRYYTTAYETKPLGQNRMGFYDHGITSALIFWHAWRSFAQAVRVVAKMKPGAQRLQNIPESCHGKILDISKQLLSPSTVDSVVMAIALHNINKDIWAGRERKFANKKIHIGKFRIHLKDDRKRGYTATPLAFLLALVDTLQDWGRPKFRPRVDQDRDQELADIDFSIKAMGDGGKTKIGLFFRRDARFRGDYTRLQELREPDALYCKMVKRLKAFLEEGAITQIIALNTSIDEAPTVYWEGRPLSPVEPAPHPAGGVGHLPSDSGSSCVDTPSSFRLEEDHVKKIKTLTAQFPANKHDRDSLESCQNKPDKKKMCVRCALSLLLMAELHRCGEAAADTGRVLEVFGHVKDYYEITRTALPEPKDLDSFHNDVMQLCNAVEKLFSEAARVQIPRNGPRPSLRRFLEHRLKNRDNYKQDTAQVITDLELVKKRWKACKHGRDCLERWQRDARLRESFSRLKDPLNMLFAHLDGVLLARTKHARKAISDAFSTDFRPENFEKHCEQALRRMPHLHSENEHLSIWP